MKYPDDYHEYVFKDGKLIGKFEEMYHFSKDIPWHQDKTAHKVSSDIAIAILKQYRYNTILDVGAGLGYFTNRLSKELKNSFGGGRPLVTGVEISQTAVEHAKKKYPHIKFLVSDIRKSNFLKGRKFDLVVCKELMWYVFDRLDVVKKNLNNAVKKDGYLFISQCFPEEYARGEDFVGRAVIGSPFQLKAIFENTVPLKYFCIEWDSNYNQAPVAHILLHKGDK